MYLNRVTIVGKVVSNPVLRVTRKNSDYMLLSVLTHTASFHKVYVKVAVWDPIVAKRLDTQGLREQDTILIEGEMQFNAIDHTLQISAISAQVVDRAIAPKPVPAEEPKDPVEQDTPRPPAPFKLREAKTKTISVPVKETKVKGPGKKSRKTEPYKPPARELTEEEKAEIPF